MAVRISLFGALLAGVLAVAPAAAAPPTRSAPTDAHALDLFEQSARAYSEGRFQDAVDKLLEARRYKAEPVLLYNLGRAYEALGHPADAADAYAKYLEEQPEAPDRGAIEGRITTLRGQALELAAVRRDPESPPPQDERSIIAPFVLAGLGAVGVGAGVVLSVMADDRHDDAVAEPAQLAAAATQEEAESLARAATITFIAGAVVAAMGLAWLGIRAVQPRATSRRLTLGVAF